MDLPNVDIPTDLAGARCDWQKASAERRELLDKLADARAALRMFERGEQASDDALPETTLAAARRHIAGRMMSVRRLQIEVLDLEDAVADMTRRHSAAAEQWQAAQRRAAAELLARLKPRHRLAVADIASAIERLSAAVEAERSVRQELAAAGLALHGSLEDAGSAFGTLAEYYSPLSTWRRRMHDLKVLP